MDLLLNSTFTQLQSFLIILVRVSGMFIISPIFGKQNVPNILKIGIMGFISLLISNIVKVPALSFENNILGYTLILLKEFLVGLDIGFVSFIFLSSLFLAGQLIDTQIGFGVVSVVDPQSNIQVPITGNFYYIIAIIVFFITNGHQVLIAAVVDSYNIVPVNKMVINHAVLTNMISTFTQMFVIAIKISMPIVGTMFIIDFTLGIISRTMPQMNVFVVGMPLKIFVGLFIMVLTFSIIVNVMGNMYDSMYTDIYKSLRGMSP